MPPGQTAPSTQTMRPSFATRGNLDLIEENYRRWEKNPESVDGTWRAFFEGFELGNTPQRNGAAAVAAPARGRERRESPLQTRVDGLVYAYRTLGHTIARINPLADRRPENPLLTLRELGFSEKDLDLQVSSKFFLDNKKMTLREMIARLEEIYADTIGTEFQHIQNPRIRNWVRDRTRIAAGEAPGFDAGGDCAAATASRIGGVRSFPPHPLCRAETLFASGRGIAHGYPRHHPASLPGRRDRGNLHGDGASRPAQCAGEFSPEIARGNLHRVQHELHSRARRGRRRREISPRLSHDSQARVGRGGGDSSGRQPEPSRGGRSGGGRDRARPAAHSRRHRASAESFAACLSMATRLLPARGSSRKRSTCRNCTATARAARSTWW